MVKEENVQTASQPKIFSFDMILVSFILGC